MNKELNGRLADVARDVRSRADTPQAADEVVAAALDVVGRATGAGVTLTRPGRRLETVAASSALVRRGDALQYELGEGPCLDATWSEEQVYTGELADDGRWPAWAPRVAAELGIHSMLCTQLFTNEDQLGALNVYAAEPDAFDAEDREVMRLLAAHAAVGVAAAQEIDNLRTAIDRRTTIGKALGILMCRYELDDDQAMAVLRRLSSHHNRKLYDLAVEVTHSVGLGALGGEAVG